MTETTQARMAPSDAVVPNDDRMQLFISYSRRDAEAAVELVKALENKGFNVTIDTRDLPFGEEWQQELRDFIHAADTVIWLVSPDSVGSRWVNWELGEVQRAGKRLFPVVTRETQPETLPDALGKLHLLPAKGAFKEDDHLDTLVSALHTDRGWIKEHTRLGMIAREWQAAGQGTDRLLRGSALKVAQAWRVDRPSAAPAPDPAILELLAASELGAKSRQRTLIGSLAAVAVVLAGLAVYAFIQQGIAVENEALAVEKTRLADRRAARMSASTAERLREDGFVAESMVLLLDSAQYFTDDDATSGLRIEMERLLESQSAENARVLLPVGTKAIVQNGALHLTDQNGDPIPLPLQNIGAKTTAPQKFNCDEVFNSDEFTFAYDDFYDSTECERKGNYILVHQSYLGASGGTEAFTILMQGLPDPVFSLDRDYFFQERHWTVQGQDAAFVFNDDNTLTHYLIKDGERGEPQKVTLDREGGTPFLVTPQRLLVVTGFNDAYDNEQVQEDRLLIDIELGRESPFYAAIPENPDTWIVELMNINFAAAALRQPQTCLEAPDYGSELCSGISPDGQWRYEAVDKGLTLYRADDPEPITQIKGRFGRGVSFYRNGPDLVLVDPIEAQNVSILSPGSEPQAPWTSRLIYRSSQPVESAETDPSGDVLIIASSGEAKTIEGLAYAISARKPWRSFGMKYPYAMVRVMKNGDVFAGTGVPSIQRFPPLSEMAEMLRAALPQRCHPPEEGNADNKSDWRQSPCWPDWIE